MSEETQGAEMPSPRKRGHDTAKTTKDTEALRRKRKAAEGKGESESDLTSG